MVATTAGQILTNRFKWPLRTVLYSQVNTNSPTGHRCDCSGFVSMCLGLPTPGENTVTLLTEKHVYPIDWSQLQPGDMVGKLGPGTAGDAGHVALVTDVAANFYTIWEQGGGYGPTIRGLRIGQPWDYKPYRSSYLVQGEIDVIYARTNNDQTVWVSNGVTRRTISRQDSYKLVGKTVIYVADEAALTDLCGPPDVSHKVLAELTVVRNLLANWPTGDTAALIAHTHTTGDAIPKK